MSWRRIELNAWIKALWVVCAILLSFMVVAQLIVGSFFQAIAGENVAVWLRQPAVLFSLTALMYLIAGAIIWFGYRVLRVDGTFIEDTRVRKWPTLPHIGLIGAALGGYLITTLTIGLLARWLFPGLPWDQAQETGYARTESIVQLVVIGVALVVAAPIMEEIIFRGVMFSRVRRFLPVQATTIVVALAFGLAHQQLNVGLDTFILGLFLGYLRAETDSVWPAIMLHMLKNCVAFMLLFVLWPWTS